MQGKDGLFGLYKHHYEHTDLSITDIQRREIATQEFSPQLSAFNRAQYFPTKENCFFKNIHEIFVQQLRGLLPNLKRLFLKS